MSEIESHGEASCLPLGETTPPLPTNADLQEPEKPERPLHPDDQLPALHLLMVLRTRPWLIDHLRRDYHPSS